MPTQVEVRSIDYVPLSERHGKLWHLGPLRFMGNAQIATLAVGDVRAEAKPAEREIEQLERAAAAHAAI